MLDEERTIALLFLHNVAQKTARYSHKCAWQFLASGAGWSPALEAQVIDAICETDHKLTILEFDLRRVALIR